MQAILDAVTGSPIFLALAILLVSAFVLSAVLRLVKVALFLALVLAVYIGWLHHTGSSVPPEIRRAEENIRRTTEEAGKALKEHAQEAGRFVSDQARKAGEQLEKEVGKEAKEKPSEGGGASPPDEPSGPAADALPSPVVKP